MKLHSDCFYIQRTCLKSFQWLIHIAFGCKICLVSLKNHLCIIPSNNLKQALSQNYLLQMRVKVLAILSFVSCQLLWQYTFAQQKTNTTKWVVQGGGSLKVDGSTNINNFTCRIVNYNTPDTLSIVRTKDISLPMVGKISLDIAAFNCGNPIMTSDLRKTLKCKEFPKLIINFISLSKLPDPSKQNTDITGLVDIVLPLLPKIIFALRAKKM